MKTSRLSLAYASALAILIALGGATHAFASSGGANSLAPPTDPEFINPVVLGTTYETSLDAADYANSFGTLPDSVSYSEYAVSGPATIAITIVDEFYVADYYQLYEDTDVNFVSPPPTLVGTTPQVHTDTNLEAPTYNPLWDGSGSTHSTSTFTVTIGSGTTYFVLVDALFDAMGSALDAPCGTNTATLVTSGCTATGISVSDDFSPAGYSISFNTATAGVPEFSSSPFLALAALPLVMLIRAKLRLSSRA